jgi:hydrogenase nickel incorporation protein HypB
MNIPVVENILKVNDQVAQANREIFEKTGVCAVNVMASAGAGKTSLLLATAARLPKDKRVGVLEGDIATSIDAEKVAEAGLPVVQINTGGSCHLEAHMVARGLPHLSLTDLDILFIENIGNLICPASFDLGERVSVVVASVPEGCDKPHKYPKVFSSVNAVVLNKWDVAESEGFDLDFFRQGLRAVNPDAPLFVLSCKTGEGFQEWIDWLVAQPS